MLYFLIFINMIFIIESSPLFEIVYPKNGFYFSIIHTMKIKLWKRSKLWGQIIGSHLNYGVSNAYETIYYWLWGWIECYVFCSKIWDKINFFYELVS